VTDDEMRGLSLREAVVQLRGAGDEAGYQRWALLRYGSCPGECGRPATPCILPDGRGWCGRGACSDLFAPLLEAGREGRAT
jgi:hypothetical protein